MDKFKLNKYGIVLFITGFAALVYEIVFIKTLSLFIGQSIYAFSVMLASFMIGIGAGSIYSPRIKGDPLYVFSLTQLGIAAYSIFFLPVLNNTGIPVYIASSFSFIIKSVILAGLSMLMMIVPAFLMGLGFPLIAGRAADEKEDKNQIGKLFAYNTLGGLFGSMTAGFIFLPQYGVSSTLVIAAVINLFAALIIKTKAISKRIAFAVSLLVLLFVIKPELDPLAAGAFYNADNYSSLANFLSSVEKSRDSIEILYSDFDVYGHVLVTKQGPYKILSINGKPDGGTSEDVITELMIGYIPMLLHENPENVAVIGLGTGLTTGAVLQFENALADVYEINPGVIEACKFFEEENHNALSNPNTNIIIGDARKNLTASDKIYDIIISEPSNPWVEGEGFLFTHEFYEIVEDRLAEDGIFVQWIGSYDYTEEAFDIVLNTLHSIFPEIQIWSDGSDFYFISSKAPGKFDYGAAAAKLNDPVIKADMELIGYFGNKKINTVDIFFSHFVTHFKKTGNTKINTDDNSIIEFSTGKFSGSAINHVQRLVANRTRTLPVNISREDFDIKFDSSLPISESKYLITQIESDFIINKQMLMKDETNSLFIQTQIQSEPPAYEQAKELADLFKAQLIESDKYLFSFEGEAAHGIIGYCGETQKSFVAYTNVKGPIDINCK